MTAATHLEDDQRANKREGKKARDKWTAEVGVTAGRAGEAGLSSL
ncbi:hypothetical protein EYF80_063626 [Liparis tanakae]|uniref:Uncharacterized protein n=1 Tax=Liparis tanakae TaxID=230148 RepID=A0A4Z2EBM0_9TELE|nr:hypothetical protein EYF80_063626 [Liparis tanakae]